MRNPVVLAAFVAMASGCSPNEFGIWAVTLDAGELGGDSFTILHNYADAVEPPDTDIPGPWDYDSTAKTSAAIVMAQIFGLDSKGEDDVLLVIGGDVFPGHATDEKNGWQFVWDNFDDEVHSETHRDGYVFTSTSSTHTTTTIDLIIDGKTATGSFLTEVVWSDDWTESDLWDRQDNGIGFSQVPSGAYVFDAGGLGIDNTDAGSECTSSPCSLTVETRYEVGAELTGALTRYKSMDAFDAVDGAGQPFGTGDAQDPYDPYYY